MPTQIDNRGESPRWPVAQNGWGHGATLGQGWGPSPHLSKRRDHGYTLSSPLHPARGLSCTGRNWAPRGQQLPKILFYDALSPIIRNQFLYLPLFKMHVAASALGRHSHISVKWVHGCSAWKGKESGFHGQAAWSRPAAAEDTRRGQGGPTGHDAPQGAEREGAPVEVWRGGGRHKQGDGWWTGGNDVFTNFVTHSFNKDPEYWHKVRHTYISEVRILKKSKNGQKVH